jgi:hypothetical protein
MNLYKSSKEENDHLETISLLHPHKALLKDWRPRFYVVRKGWGSFKKVVEQYKGV